MGREISLFPMRKLLIFNGETLSCLCFLSELSMLFSTISVVFRKEFVNCLHSTMIKSLFALDE